HEPWQPAAGRAHRRGGSYRITTPPLRGGDAYTLSERRRAGDGAVDAVRPGRGRSRSVLLPGCAGVVGPLFEEPGAFDREGLAQKLKQLAAQNIFIGGSSWKYPGWLGQIYRRERYLSRGKFSKKLFEAECLREYAEVFPTVCGDFAFYQFPTDEFWRKLFQPTPEPFRFAFKVPEQ